jgi:hypothetical protein
MEGYFSGKAFRNNGLGIFDLQSLSYYEKLKKTMIIS